MSAVATKSEFRSATEIASERGVAVAGQRPEWVGLAVEAAEQKVTPAQVEVLKRTICAKLSNDQLLLYLTICARKGVDPFTEAFAFPNSDGGLAFGLRIDGMRSLAMATGEYISRKIEAIFSPDDKKTLIGARAEITRSGMAGPVVEEAWNAEYFKKGFTDEKGHYHPSMWERYPETMIKKVAESKALRAAFPDALAGVYEPAEIRPDQE